MIGDSSLDQRVICSKLIGIGLGLELRLGLGLASSFGIATTPLRQMTIQTSDL